MSVCICLKSEHLQDLPRCGGPNTLGNINPFEVGMNFLPGPSVTEKGV